jgi:hypothetical protein
MIDLSAGIGLFGVAYTTTRKKILAIYTARAALRLCLVRLWRSRNSSTGYRSKNRNLPTGRLRLAIPGRASPTALLVVSTLVVRRIFQI